MTTVPSTPTSDGLGGVPAGLPDVTLLAQLAGEFFAALPSGSHDARLPFGAPPQPPQTELALANRAPALAPAPTAAGKNSSLCPAFSRAMNSARCATASRGSRLMNTVPVARASQPIPAQPATSALAT